MIIPKDGNVAWHRTERGRGQEMCIRDSPYFKSMNNFILCIKPRQLENTMPFMDTFLHFRERTASSRRRAVSGADREKIGKKRNNESPDSAIPSRRDVYKRQILLGVLEAMGAAYVSIAWKDAIAFLVLILILIFRPTGLLGERVAEKI